MINVNEYTPLDGRSHKWDNVGEAIKTLTYHYWCLARMIIFGTPRKKV